MSSSRAASSSRTMPCPWPTWTSEEPGHSRKVAGTVSAPTITVASYNMRKAIGLDRRRDPRRVLEVLREIDADVVALQEADKRMGGRGAAVPHDLIDEHGLYQPVHLGVRHRRALEKARRHAEKLLKVDTRNIGWHGRSEERRVGKECRSRRSLYDE